MVQLRYRFEPGHEDDGVSALIPLHVLNQLPEEPFEWLVPGLFDEKVERWCFVAEELRGTVPVPEAVACAPQIEPGRGSLHEQSAMLPAAPAACRCRAMPSARTCCRRICA